MWVLATEPLVLHKRSKQLPLRHHVSSKTGASSVAQAVLELNREPILAFHSQKSSCLGLPSYWDFKPPYLASVY